MRCLNSPSGETRRVLVACMATVGQVGNTDHLRMLPSARRAATVGRIIRPDQSRCIDEPRRSSPWRRQKARLPGGRHPVTPWGQPTRGYKTRNNKRTDAFIISRG